MDKVESWWEPFYEDLFANVQLVQSALTARAEQEATMVQTRLSLSPGQSVLDVPCGTGRIGNILASRGFQVTGVDFNPAVLAKAREEARKQQLRATYVQQDMRELAAVAQFDAALCFWGSFGYFDDADNEAFVAAVARALKRGGRFLVDTPAADSLPRIYQPRQWQWLDEEKRIRLVSETNYDPYTGRTKTQWALVGPDTFVERESSIRLYTLRELNEIFLRNGFAHVEAFNGHEAGPYSMLSNRLVVVATKAN